MKSYCVCCLDDAKTFIFTADSPRDALEKMRYTLDLERKDTNAKIKATNSGMHLYMDHSGKTYSVHTW